MFAYVFYLTFLHTFPILERVWKILSAKWGVQIAGMIFQTRSNSSNAIFLSIPPAYPVRLPFAPTTR